MAKERLPRIVAPLGGGTGITSDHRLVTGVTGRGRALSLSDGMVAMPKGGRCGSLPPFAACAMPKPQQFASLKPQISEREIAASLRFDGHRVEDLVFDGSGFITDRYLRSRNWADCEYSQASYAAEANLSAEATFTYLGDNGFWRNRLFEQSSPKPETPSHYAWVKASGTCTATKDNMQTAAIGKFPIFALVRMSPLGQRFSLPIPLDELRRSATFTATRTQNTITLTVSVNNHYLVAGAGTWSVTIELAALDARHFYPRIVAQFASGIEAAPREPIALNTSWAGTFDVYHVNETLPPFTLPSFAALWTFGIWPF